MSLKRLFLVGVLLTIFGAPRFTSMAEARAKGQFPLVSFSSGDLAPLKAAFDDSASSIRILVMLSPT